jgi:hypothetical protein
MAEQEVKRPDKTDFMMIVTPNNAHFATMRLPL